MSVRSEQKEKGIVNRGNLDGQKGVGEVERAMKLGIESKHTLISNSKRKGPMRKIAVVAIDAHWSTSSTTRLSFHDYFTSEAAGRWLDGKVLGTSHAEPRWSDCMADW